MTNIVDITEISALPYWLASAKPTGCQVLNEDIRADVAIIGGGLVGITTAYLLAKENISVALIEANLIGQGTSGHTTGKITCQHDLIYSKLIDRFGLEIAKQYAQANQEAIKFLTTLITSQSIACDFSKQAAYLYTQQDEYVKVVEDEIEAAGKVGIKAQALKEIPLPFAVKIAERFDEQAQFHPGKFISSLVKIIQQSGGRLFEQTRAIDFLAGSPFTIITENRHKVFADEVVVASHFPVFDGGGCYFARVHPDRSYAIAIKAKEKFPGGMYITPKSPVRSLRSTPYKDGELIIIVGEHHRTGQGVAEKNHYRNLVDFAEKTFTVEEIPYRWSAQDYMSADDVPYVGRISPEHRNVYVATGFRKWGISNGIAAATLIRDLIVKGESPYWEAFNPARFRVDAKMQQSMAAGTKTAKEIIAVKPENISPQDEPEKNQALVVEGEKGRIGLYKDNEGNLYAVNITCTHLGCELVWNEAELSWDCPCHGSRYSYSGEIIEGPTLHPLGSDKIKT